MKTMNLKINVFRYIDFDNDLFINILAENELDARKELKRQIEQEEISFDPIEFGDKTIKEFVDELGYICAYDINYGLTFSYNVGG